MVESQQYALFESAKPRAGIRINIAIGVKLSEDSFYRLHDSVDATVGELAAFAFTILDDRFTQ